MVMTVVCGSEYIIMLHCRRVHVYRWWTEVQLWLPCTLTRPPARVTSRVDDRPAYGRSIHCSSVSARAPAGHSLHGNKPSGPVLQCTVLMCRRRKPQFLYVREQKGHANTCAAVAFTIVEVSVGKIRPNLKENKPET